LLGCHDYITYHLYLGNQGMQFAVRQKQHKGSDLTLDTRASSLL
jgi:hypothetical protein